jgi:uncharacterized repeat protein (TIGR01451 family)
MVHRHRTGSFRLFLLVLFLGASAETLAQPYVYLANNAASNVSAYSMGATGALAPLSPPLIGVGSNPGKIAITPNQAFAYVTNYALDAVGGFAINPATGGWTAVPGSPFATGSGPIGVAVSPNGSFLYVTNRNGSSVSAYKIGVNGALTPVAGSPFTAGNVPIGIAVTPNGAFAYVANNSSGNVSGFSINATTGALTAVPGSPFAAGNGPVGLAISPNGAFVYVPNTNAATFSVYAVNAGTGALSAAAGSPFQFVYAGPEVAITPNGAFAYNVEPFTGTWAFTLNTATGAMAAVAGSPFGTWTGQLWSLAISPDGTVAYVTRGDSISGNVSAYTINGGTGSLSEIVGSPFAAGPRPYGVAIANPVVVIAPPAISKAFGAASIALNGTTSLTFTLQNNNASALTGVGFTDALPAGLAVSTPNGLAGACGGGAITAAAGSGSVSLTGATLAAGASCTFGVNVTGTTLGIKNNVTGAVTSVESGPGGTASASVTVAAVTSFTGPTATGSGSATVSFTGGGPACQFTNVAFIPLVGGPTSPPPGSAPAGVAFPHGLLDFATGGCTPGATLNFTVVYPQPLAPGAVYWKYGPTSAVPAPHWYTIPANVAGNTITFSIADGGLGDDDLAANGTVVDVGGAGAPPAGASFYPLPPCRVGDTRRPNGPLDGPALQPGAARSFAPAGTCGIPTGAVAISANLTVTNVRAAGELVVFPSDVAKPNATSISFAAGRTRANNDVVVLSGSGTSFSVFNNSSAPVDFIFDVNGYFQ